MLQHGVWVKGCEASGCVEVSLGLGAADGNVDQLTRTVDGGAVFRGGTDMLSFTLEEWDNFRAAALRGEFDL